MTIERRRALHYVARQGGPVRILLIADSAKLARTLKASLEQQGYAVDVATTAIDADELAVVEHHDVIILDVTPPIDGLELCRRLRQHKVVAPILMVSVLASTADMVAGLDSGADDYVVKPFHSDELFARLRSLLRRSPVVEGVLLRVGELTMDLSEHQVAAHGVLMRLTAKEFALLQFMMRNPRRLLTRAMIAESVWDMNYEAGSNVIDVYVSSLRRKLGHVPGVPRIETVIGSGYRFLEVPDVDDDAPQIASE